MGGRRTDGFMKALRLLDGWDAVSPGTLASRPGSLSLHKLCTKNTPPDSSLLPHWEVCKYC